MFVRVSFDTCWGTTSHVRGFFCHSKSGSGHSSLGLDEFHQPRCASTRGVGGGSDFSASIPGSGYLVAGRHHSRAVNDSQTPGSPSIHRLSIQHLPSSPRFGHVELSAPALDERSSRGLTRGGFSGVRPRTPTATAASGRRAASTLSEHPAPPMAIQVALRSCCASGCPWAAIGVALWSVLGGFRHFEHIRSLHDDKLYYAIQNLGRRQ